MNLRTAIRRARAVAALYLAAYIDAEVAYKGTAGKDEHEARLHDVSSMRDALEHIVCAIGSISAYPTMRARGVGGKVVEASQMFVDGGHHARAAWLLRVGADVSMRIEDPKGTRGIPVPSPAQHFAAAAREDTAA